MRQDRQETQEDRRREREREEMARWHAEGQDRRVAYQRQLDAWWQAKLDIEEEIRAMRASGEIPECGVYDPVARFEREVKEGR
jgi:hypothetical protein